MGKQIQDLVFDLEKLLVLGQLKWKRILYKILR